MKNKRQGFTLIELLVVIAIIALLLSIILPSLRKAKEQARNMICRSNLKQWGTVFLMYTSDNNETFWEDGPNNGGHVRWLPMLAGIYGDCDNFRLCPMATQQRKPIAGMGATFLAWGGDIYDKHGFVNEENRNYGSYGTNLWINSVAETQGWMNMPERQWQKTTSSKNTSSVPMIFDCVWFGTNFFSSKDSRGNATWSAPTPEQDFFLTQGDNPAGVWAYLSGRLCINRHDKGINMCFMDGSANKVFLPDLWSKNWHVDYSTVSDVKIPWLSQ